MRTNLSKMTWIVMCSLVTLGSCKKSDSSPGTTNPTPGTTTGNPAVDDLIAMNASESFDYELSKDVSLNITILAPDNTPIKNIPINVLTKAEELGGTVLFRGLTDNDGKISGAVKFPTYLTQVVVDAKYLGVIRNAAVDISGATVLCTLGGSTGYSGNVVLNSPISGRQGKMTGGASNKPLAFYTYLGTYDDQGKPNYLETDKDVISGTFLSNINASLPEGRPVMTYHPDYLNAAAETNVNVTALSDVWFTFVTEGAGYRNSIAFFTYPTSKPPQSTSDIDSLHIILPNASLSGSGGALSAGNKVKLGRFRAGTSIGFALIADGWNGKNVGNGNWIVYSLDQLNAPANAALKRQSVLLYDNTQGLFLVGFEDIRRDNSGCDNDFNDCIFYVKGNPVTALSPSKVNPLDRPVDTDGDGVNDTYDEFPTDPTRAYINYYPSRTTMGTLAFEDNWPFLGDYDMNDLVVGYRYTVISNGLNKAVEMKAQYVLKASGATFRNGFGVEFPFLASLVKSASGSLVTNNQVVSTAANGCEAGQTKAVIIPFDDAFTAMNVTNGFINTFSGNSFLNRDTINMNLTFTKPLLQSELGMAPFNPFIIINRTRGREAHLPGYTPTQKVDVKLFKTGADNTNPAQNKYYKTNSNLPWGLGFTDNFSYPLETKAINNAYKKFIPWVQSSGASNANWYSDTLNMNSSLIYKK